MILLSKYVVATGEIFGQISVPNQEDATLNTFSLEPGQALIDGHFSEQTHYIADDQAVLRPATGLPETYSIATGTDWPVADVPEGTEVSINGEIVGTVDASGLVLAFGLAGVWKVSLRPPFPWLAADCEVTVT